MRPRVLSPSAALSLTRRYATSTTGRLPYGSQGSNRFSDFLESGEGSMADAPMDNAAEDKALPAFKYHGNFGKPKTAVSRCPTREKERVSWVIVDQREPARFSLRLVPTREERDCFLGSTILG